MIPVSTGRSAENQLDQLQGVTNAIVFTSLVIILADAAAEENVSFLGLTTDISGAYGIAAFILLLAFLMLALLFARLADMVTLADEAELPNVLAALFGHAWPLSPFAFYGGSIFATVHSSLGIGLLSFIWWLSLTAIAQLWNRMSFEADGFDIGLWYAFVSAGVLGLLAMLNVHRVVALRLEKLAIPGPGSEPPTGAWNRTFMVRCIVGVLFGAAGYWVFDALTNIGM